ATRGGDGEEAHQRGRSARTARVDAAAGGAPVVNRIERLIAVSKKDARRIIGLMSGTSLDAIDAAMVLIRGHGTDADVVLEHFRSFPFPPKIRGAVRDLFRPDKARVDQICRYDFILGELFAAAVLRLCQ